MSVFLISLPIFLIVFIGWLLRKLNVVTESWISVLNLFAYYVSLPALIVSSFWEIDFLSRELWRLIFLSAISLILFCLVVFILLSILRLAKEVKATVFLSAIVGNTIYMGFPVIELSLGKEYLISGALVASIYLIIALLVSMFVIRYWQGENQRITQHLQEFLKNPLVISVFLGAILSFLKVDYPLILSFKKSITMLGLTASPVALFAMGGFLYGRFLRKNLNLVILGSFLKLIAFPLLLFLGAFYMINVFVVSAADLRVLILLSSMPVAVTTFVIAERFNLDKALVGNSILISTIFSFIVVPLIIFLL